MQVRSRRGGGVPQVRSLALGAVVLPPSRWARREWRKNPDPEPRRPLGPVAPPYLGDQLEKHAVGGRECCGRSCWAFSSSSAARRALDQRLTAAFVGSLEHRADGITVVFKRGRPGQPNGPLTRARPLSSPPCSALSRRGKLRRIKFHSREPGDSVRITKPGIGLVPGILADARKGGTWALEDPLLFTFVSVPPAPLTPPHPVPTPAAAPAWPWPRCVLAGTPFRRSPDPLPGQIKKDVSCTAADRQRHQLLKRFIGPRARNCFYSNLNISKGKKKKKSPAESL